MGSSLFGSLGGLFDDSEEGIADEKDLELSQRASLLRSLSPGFRSAVSSAPSPPSPERGALRTAWDYATSPLKALAGATGTLSAQLVRPFAPEAYAEAASELEEENRGGPQLLKPLENLPGLGDVAAQGISKEGLTGALVRPVARIGLNILGDPTSYVGAGILSRIPKVGRLAQELGGAQKLLGIATEAGAGVRIGGRTAEEIASSIPGIAERLAAATTAETAVGRGARRLVEGAEGLGRSGASGEALRSVLQAPSFAQAVRGAGRLGATLPFSPIVGAAYAPELLESVGSGVAQTIEDVKAGRYAEAAATGAGALLVAGLGRQVAKGLMSEARAAGILERSLARQLGETPPGSERPLPAEPELAPEDTGTLGVTPAASREAPPVPPPVAPEVPPGAATVPPPVGSESPALIPLAAQPMPNARQPVEPPAVAIEPPPLTPLPGTERIKVERTPEALDRLTSILDSKSGTDKFLTKKDLIDAKLVTPKQAKAYSVEALLDALGGTEHRARLESVPGYGFRVRAAEARAEAPAEAPAGGAEARPPEPAVETPPEAPPVRVEPPPTAADPDLAGITVHPDILALEDEAVLGMPAAEAAAKKKAEIEHELTVERMPRAEIDRQIGADPELGALAETTLRDIASGSGKPFTELTADDVRLAFPGDENKASRATLNRVLFAVQKKERMTAVEAGAGPTLAAAAPTEPLREKALTAPTETIVAREAPPAVPPTPPSKPTPDRILRIGRGAHGQVRVVFPDKLHADLFSAPGRSRRMISDTPGINPQWDSLAKQLGVDRKQIGEIAQKYRADVQASIKGLAEDADFEAPRAVQAPVPVEPSPGMAAAARGLEGELSGRKIAPIPDKAPATAPAAEELPTTRRQRSFAEHFARMATGKSASEGVIDDLLRESPSKPQRASPFERTLNRVTGLSEDQRAALSDAYEMRQRLAGHGGEMKFETLDPDLRTSLGVKTHEQFADFSKRTGIKDPADWALLRSTVDLFDDELERSRSALAAATKSGAPTEDLQRQFASAGLRRSAILDTLIPDLGKC